MRAGFRKRGPPKPCKSISIYRWFDTAINFSSRATRPEGKLHRLRRRLYRARGKDRCGASHRRRVSRESGTRSPWHFRGGCLKPSYHLALGVERVATVQHHRRRLGHETPIDVDLRNQRDDDVLAPDGRPIKRDRLEIRPPTCRRAQAGHGRRPRPLFGEPVEHLDRARLADVGGPGLVRM
jgi:hypothetical protein